MAQIELQVSTEKYQARYTTLQGYVKQMETLKGNYQSKMKEIPSIWSDEQADEYYNVINANIEKVQKAIEAAQQNMTQIQNIINNMSTTSQNVSSVVNDAANIAQNLFL